MSHIIDLEQTPDWLRCIPVGVGYFRHDVRGCHPLAMNDALGRMFGMDIDGIARDLDGGLGSIVHPEEAERLRLMIYKAGVTGGTYRTLGSVIRPGQETRFVDIWLESEPQGDGSSLFCLVLADSNMQMTSTRKLDNSYERLLGVMENVPGGIVVLDTINGKILTTIFASSGIGKLLHGTHDQVAKIYQKDFMAGVHPDDREKVTHILEEAVRNLADFQVSLRLETARGDYTWVAASGNVEATEGHRIVYLSIVDFSTDHETQVIQKTVLENFSRHQYQYICIINGMNDSYRILASSDATGIDVPREGEDFERTIDGLIDRYVPTDEREELRRSLRLENLIATLRTRPDVELFYNLLVPDGRKLYHEVWVTWVDRRKRLLALVASNHTEEHLLEERSRQALSDALRAAEQASVAKSEFLSRMSHDIRTPLNAIMGFTEMSLDDPDVSAEEKERLSKVASSSRFLLTLINDVLDMSRIESGKLTLNEGTLYLPELIEGVSSIVGPQCAEKGISFRCTMGEGTRASFAGDALKLQQILINLLGNAVKFTPRGGSVSLGVEQTKGDDSHAILAFHVDDTGRGVSEEFIPHIFETFSQERRNPSDEHRGSGLGLAICHNLVSMMNGSIQVDSKPGEGTRFVVEIPLRRIRGGQLPAREMQCARGNSSGVPDFSGKRVLLAEDNTMNMEIACYLLGRVNLDVERVDDGRKALDLFTKSDVGHFDAILTDIVMPEMGGRELAGAIRRLDRADAATVPIIAMSADAFEEDVQRSLICGINAYVVKPIDAACLYETLARYL